MIDRKIFSRVFLVLLVSAGLAQGQFIDNISKVGTTSASFLEIGVGPKAISMGGAFVSVADDATAMYWNPGGLSRVAGNQAIFIHTQWLADISHSYAGAVFQMGRDNTFGASVTTVGMDEMAVRTVEKPEGTGEMFNASSMSIALTGARNLTDRVSFGMSAKYIQEQIWHMNAVGFAIDVGTLFRTNFHGLSLGMSITNFGNKMQLQGRDTQVKHDIAPDEYGNNSKISGHLDTDSWSLPLNFRVGASMNPIETRWARWTISVDAMHPNNNTESVNIGSEFAIGEMIFLRGGYRSMFQDFSQEGLTLGGGLKYQMAGLQFMADYAYADFGLLNTVQRFSFGLGF